MSSIESRHQIVKRFYWLKLLGILSVIRVWQTWQLLVKVDVAEVSKALSLRIVLVPIFPSHGFEWVNNLMHGRCECIVCDPLHHVSAVYDAAVFDWWSMLELLCLVVQHLQAANIVLEQISE